MLDKPSLVKPCRSDSGCSAYAIAGSRYCSLHAFTATPQEIAEAITIDPGAIVGDGTARIKRRTVYFQAGRRRSI